MASWHSREISGDGKHLPPLKQKSKIPVRVTRLSSDSDKSASSEDDGGKKPSLSKDSVENFKVSDHQGFRSGSVRKRTRLKKTNSQ